MSYYFAIVGTLDNPLFEQEFGTSKSGGDGNARFKEDQRHLNQFIVHAALDIVEEVQWGSGNMYLKHLDRHQNNYISTFLTASNVKFMLLYQPPAPPSLSSTTNPSPLNPARAAANASNYNPTATAVEEAQKNFFLDVYDVWVKTVMSPFYSANMPVRSPVFKARVVAAARKYL